MDDAGKVLWVEDNPTDIQLLTEACLVSELVVGCDGEGGNPKAGLLDLKRSYDLAAGAYVVKPMSCHDFVEAIEEVGRFWGFVNQPPVRGKRR